MSIWFLLFGICNCLNPLLTDAKTEKTEMGSKSKLHDWVDDYYDDNPYNYIFNDYDQMNNFWKEKMLGIF